MKQIIVKKLAFVIATTMFVIIILNLVIQRGDAKNHLISNAQLATHQIDIMLKKNEEDLIHLTESLKEEYIVRAKAVAYLVENEAQMENSEVHWKEIAKLLQVDEISLFDTKGTLYSGSRSEYCGLNFNDGEQISFFLPMLEDKNLVLCQDMMPNTAENKMMMYAAVWRKDGKGIVQIGIEPNRIKEAQEKNEIDYLLSNVWANENLVYYVADKETLNIIGSTNNETVGQNVKEILGTNDFPKEKEKIVKVTNSGISNYYFFTECDDYYIGVSQQGDRIFANVNNSNTRLVIYLLIASYIMLAVSFKIVDNYMVKGMEQLVEEVQEVTNGRMEKVIDVDCAPEFKMLSESINQMRESLLEHTTKISKILDTVDIQLAVYECSMKSQSVFATGRMGVILMLPEDEMQQLLSDKKMFLEKIKQLKSYPVEGFKNIYKVPVETDYYLQIETFENQQSEFGIVMDVTEEIVEKQRLQIERDYDLLTGMLTRRAFYQKMADLYRNPNAIQHAVLMMCDLDGLKQFNDTYGHANGDLAIKKAAEILSSAKARNKYVCRLSGDEFALFIYGEENDDRLRIKIKEVYDYMMKAEINVFKKTVPVRLSGGYVFYSKFPEPLDQLLKKADQALYESKENGRARFTEY